MAELHLSASVSRSWCYSCWLADALSRLTGMLELNGAVIMLIVTPVLFLLWQVKMSHFGEKKGLPQLCKEKRKRKNFIKMNIVCFWWKMYHANFYMLAWSNSWHNSLYIISVIHVIYCQSRWQCLPVRPASHYHIVVAVHKFTPYLYCMQAGRCGSLAWYREALSLYYWKSRSVWLQPGKLKVAS